jgi:hypothetical protein
MAKWRMVIEFIIVLVLAFSKMSRILGRYIIPHLRMILIGANVSSSGKIVKQALAR